MEPKEDNTEEGQEQWSELATEVALGTLNVIHYKHSQGKWSDIISAKLIIIITKGIIEKDPFAITLWEKNGIVLNNTQQKAMKLALTNQFHLIQGPPG